MVAPESWHLDSLLHKCRAACEGKKLKLSRMKVRRKFSQVSGTNERCAGGSPSLPRGSPKHIRHAASYAHHVNRGSGTHPSALIGRLPHIVLQGKAEKVNDNGVLAERASSASLWM